MLLVRIGPLELAQQPVAAFDGGVERRLGGFAAGEGVLQLGGTMIDKKATGSPGEYAGSRLDGGSRHPLAAGDVIHIPAAVPHAFLVTKGQHLTYVLVKFPE